MLHYLSHQSTYLSIQGVTWSLFNHRPLVLTMSSSFCLSTLSPGSELHPREGVTDCLFSFWVATIGPPAKEKITLRQILLYTVLPSSQSTPLMYYYYYYTNTVSVSSFFLLNSCHSIKNKKRLHEKENYVPPHYCRCCDDGEDDDEEEDED